MFVERYNFSDEVKSTLKKAGWYENRRIDLNDVESKFEAVGIEIFAAAREFLEEFDGLVLETSRGSQIFIDALAGLDVLQEDENDLEQIEYLDKILNKKLCPIGWHGSDVLLISSDNEIVYLWIWVSAGLVKDFEEAMENIVNPSAKSGKSFDLTPEQIPPSWK